MVKYYTLYLNLVLMLRTCPTGHCCLSCESSKPCLLPVQQWLIPLELPKWERALWYGMQHAAQRSPSYPTFVWHCHIQSAVLPHWYIYTAYTLDENTALILDCYYMLLSILFPSICCRSLYYVLPSSLATGCPTSPGTPPPMTIPLLQVQFL